MKERTEIRFFTDKTDSNEVELVIESRQSLGCRQQHDSLNTARST